MTNKSLSPEQAIAVCREALEKTEWIVRQISGLDVKTNSVGTAKLMATEALAVLATVSDAQEPIGTLRIFESNDTESGIEYDIVATFERHERNRALDGAKIYASPAPAVSSDASPSPVSVHPSDDRIMELSALHKILIPSSSLSEHSARVTAFARALLSTQPAQPISSEAQEPQSCPEDAIKLVQEYGDARADGDWTLSGRLIGQIIKAIREFRASPAPDVRPSAPAPQMLTFDNGMQLPIVQDGGGFKIHPDYLEVTAQPPSVPVSDEELKQRLRKVSEFGCLTQVADDESQGYIVKLRELRALLAQPASEQAQDSAGTSEFDKGWLAGLAAQAAPSVPDRAQEIEPMPNRREHELKVWPEFYDALHSGEKTFELRRDDHGFRAGDVLLLREWNPRSETYSGRSMRRLVTYIISGKWGLEKDMVCMALAAPAPSVSAYSKDAERISTLREAVIDAADEWSRYVGADSAPRRCSEHVGMAFDAAIAAQSKGAP